MVHAGEGVVEAALGDAQTQRRLATLESRLGAAAGAGALAFVAPACSLALAGAYAATYAAGLWKGAGEGVRRGGGRAAVGSGKQHSSRRTVLEEPGLSLMSLRTM